MGKSKQYYIRKSHRYLGLLLGLQFLFWTIGGLYFSWNNIDEVHGDHLRKAKRYISGNLTMVSPQLVLERVRANHVVDSLHSVQLIEIAGVPVYQVRYFSGESEHAGSGGSSHSPGHLAGGHIRTQLADAETGELLSPLGEDEAVAVAKRNVIEPAEVKKVEYITEVGSHSEYRGRPLPAWAVTFSEPNSTVYISAEHGTFQAIRHNQWRVFDFLWMLHTMDYEGRDNFGNLLLRAFSIFGLFTVISGFVLYYISSPSVRKVKKTINN